MKSFKFLEIFILFHFIYLFFLNKLIGNFKWFEPYNTSINIPSPHLASTQTHHSHHYSPKCDSKFSLTTMSQTKPAP